MTTDYRAELFGSLFVLGQHLTRRADEALAPLDLTSRQWLLLAVLTRGFPGRAPTLSEAATAYGTSRQNVKQVALQLAARGYLTLTADGTDRRATRLVLTDEVASFDARFGAREQQEFLADAFGGLTAEQVSVMADLAGRCIAHLAGGDQR
jgi:DNA-binding MarR family transcriptional regulator